VKEALILGAVLSLVSFGLVLTTNPPAILLSFAALAVAIAYPFAKRVLAMPQAVLGVAFSFGIPMAFAAAQGGMEWNLRSAPLSDTRRRFLTGSAAALALPWALAETGASAPGTGTLVLANAIYPPLVNPQGHASGEGVDIEIAREALHRGGYTGAIEIQWVP